jgi:hypothetical protein
MTKKVSISSIFQITLLFAASIVSAGEQTKSAALTDNGTIKYWYLSGPYEQPVVGFGDYSDKEIIEEEKDENLIENNLNLNWIPKQVDENNFLDIREVFGRTINDKLGKIWNAKAAYAFAVINSGKEQTVKLIFGGNSIGKVVVNGEPVYTNRSSKNAVPDEVEKEVKLRKGENYILTKVFNTHKNYSVSFFVPIKFEWGFYFRIKPGGNEITETLNTGKISYDFNITPTFFQKDIEGKLFQKLYVDITSRSFENTKANLSLNYEGNEITNSFDLNFGHNYFEIYIPVVKEKTNLNASLKIGGRLLNKGYAVEPPKKYELHLMLLSHTDIGYTNPQPIVKEKHIKTLEDVIEKTKSDKNFKWTIETVWQLEQFREAKSEKELSELIDLIKKGRISLSPLYANPFTGWISETDAIESLSLAAELKRKYGIEYNAVVYNDVPGQSWLLPQLLESAGICFLANGINEIFNDYQLQRNLPKVFLWEGSNSSKIVNYLHQSYVEGKEYGLTRGGKVVEARTWENISKIKKDYPYELILLNAAFTDNAGIAVNQYNNALKWNEEYAYPRFVISTLDEFAEKFCAKYKNELPVVKNDFTSAWDILNQGEQSRSIKLRWAQNNINSAAKLSGSLWLANDGFVYNTDLYNSVFHNMLQFTGHGSGMEYGFGNSFDNYITDAYRENYIDNAYLGTEELIQRSMFQLTKPMESLDGFGIVVFNPLTRSRNEIITVEFSALENAPYSVVDISTGDTLNCYYEGNTLSFYAKNLPGLGYKKFSLVGNNRKITKEVITDNNFIENEYFKIKIDEQTGDVSVVYDKELGRDITASTEFPFLTLLKDVFGETTNEKVRHNSNAKIELTKNNLFQSVRIEDKYELLPLIEITLFKDVKSIDIKTEFDLRKLKETDITENYNLAFPIVQKDSEIYLDILGGEYNFKLLPKWIGHQSFSIRSYIRIVNDDYQLTLVSPDARVATVDKENSLIKINLANNFPKNWNRNEKNDEMLTFNFTLKTESAAGKLQAINFGEEVCLPSLVRKTWFGSQDPVKRFVKISNPNIKLKTVKPEGDDIIFILQNVGTEKQQTLISSEYFTGKSFSLIDIWGEPIEVDLSKENNQIQLNFEKDEIKYLEVSRKTN